MKKICKDCGVEKSLELFPKHNQMSDGYLNSCKECKSKYFKEYYKRNSDRLRQYQKDYLQKNPDLVYDRQKKYLESDRGREAKARAMSNYRKRNSEKTKIRSKMTREIMNGNLPRPDGCSKCGVKCVPEGHHSEYNIESPLEVTWLCRSCHNKAHGKRSFYN